MTDQTRAHAQCVDGSHTPTQFVDDILSACDASNWDADLNKGDYYRGLRDAYEAIHEIAGEYQSAMYDWTKLRSLLATVQDGHLKYRGETDFEVELLRASLSDINRLIFANGAPLGSAAYFKIREIAAKFDTPPDALVFDGTSFKEDAAAARTPAASEPAQRSKCPYCPAPPSQFTSLENCQGFVRCENCECEFLLVPKASAILTPAAVEPAQCVAPDMIEAGARAMAKADGPLTPAGCPAPTIDDIPSCGQENDYRRARPTPAGCVLPSYDLRALAKFLYEHCALDPDRAGSIAETVLSEYDVRPK